MLNTDHAQLLQLIAHRPGNLSKGEDPQLSAHALDNHLIDLHQATILKYFFKELPKGLVYRFNAAENEMPRICSEIISSPFAILEESQRIARKLHAAAQHERIRKGILLVAILDGIVWNEYRGPAIGIYKAETTDSFMQFFNENDRINMNVMIGYAMKKLDKGCLIIPDENHETGFAALVADRHAEAQYWLNDFLGLSAEMNGVLATSQTMKLVKQFSEDVLSPENLNQREAQLDFISRSAKFFEENEAFDVETFKKDVIQDRELAVNFGEYAEAFYEETAATIPDRFQIAPEAVKKEHGKFVRSVIKLDKNFHLYVHGSKELIERGFDPEKGMNYYKVFFNQET